LVTLPFCHIPLRAQKLASKRYPRELKSLGDHLRKKRLDLGLTQIALGRQLGVGLSAIKSWEKNEEGPSPQHVAKIIAFLGYLPFNGNADRSLKDKFRLLQQIYGMSLDALAKSLGVGRASLTRWGKGIYYTPKKIVERIDALLSVEMNKCVE
jgi:DNA-binding XRE family transcriptional regulator